MFICPNVNSANYPFGQMFVCEMSIGEMSVDHLLGHGSINKVNEGFFQKSRQVITTNLT